MRGRKATISLLLFGVFLTGCTSGPEILSDWASHTGVAGGTRNDAHTGMDIGGLHGSPILAAADGKLHTVRGRATATGGCGLGITLYHPALKRWTVYCHLSRSIVKKGPIKRGQVIGYMGTSGRSMNVSHVHFEVVTDGRSHSSGDIKNTENPAIFIVGCYDNKTNYSDKQLTYPVPCKQKPVKK